MELKRLLKELLPLLQSAKSIIVGLGNPGIAFECTKHNIGFMILDDFAEKHAKHVGWKKSRDESRKTFSFKGTEVTLIKPMTGINLSGDVIRKHGYNTMDHLLVVVDDVYLPLGNMRLKAEGSSGGHNGLKDIEKALLSKKYQRLRVGVGKNGEKIEDLETYVLERFSKEEKKLIPCIMEQASSAIEIWLSENVFIAMNKINERGNGKESKII